MEVSLESSACRFGDSDIGLEVPVSKVILNSSVKKKSGGFSQPSASFSILLHFFTLVRSGSVLIPWSLNATSHCWHVVVKEKQLATGLLSTHVCQAWCWVPRPWTCVRDGGCPCPAHTALGKPEKLAELYRTL